MNRLRQLRKEKNLSAAEIAEKMGISVQHLYDLEKGERRLNEDQLRFFADLYGVSIDYILGESDRASRVFEPSAPYGPMLDKTCGPLTLEAKFSNIEGAPQKVKFIPLLGTVVAGYLSFAAQHIEGQIAVPEFWNLDFALRIKGDSLIDKGIYEGDIAVCKKYDGQPVHPGDLVVVARHDEATVKFLAQDKQGRWLLRAANPKYSDIPLNGEDRIQAIVVKIMKDAPRL